MLEPSAILSATIATWEYKSDFALYRAAQRLYLRHNKAARRRFLSWMITLPVLSVVLIALTAFQTWHGSSASFDLFAWITVCVIFLTVWFVVLRQWQLKRAYRATRKNFGIEQTRTVQFSYDEQGVVSRIVGESEGRIFWPSIKSLAQDESVTLVLFREKQFLYIPTNVATANEWMKFREYASGKTEGRIAN